MSIRESGCEQGCCSGSEPRELFPEELRFILIFDGQRGVTQAVGGNDLESRRRKRGVQVLV